MQLISKGNQLGEFFHQYPIDLTIIKIYNAIVILGLFRRPSLALVSEPSPSIGIAHRLDQRSR